MLADAADAATEPFEATAADGLSLDEAGPAVLLAEVVGLALPVTLESDRLSTFLLSTSEYVMRMGLEIKWSLEHSS